MLLSFLWFRGLAIGVVRAIAIDVFTVILVISVLI